VIFILCAPRSGTTWLTQALGAHPEIFATELRAFGQHADLVHDGGASRPRLRITLDRYVDALLAHHLWHGLESSRERMQDALVGALYRDIQRHALDRSGKRVFVDKVTPYAGTSDATVRSMAGLFPESKIIVLIRDGRDVAVSGVMHWLGRRVEGQDLNRQQVERRAFFAGQSSAPLDRLFSDVELSEWATHWREPLDAVERYGAELPTLQVRYEDMLRDPHGELRRLFHFLAVAADPTIVDASVAASTFEQMSGGRQRGDDRPGSHVRKGVAGDWATYFTRADAEIFHEIAGAALVRFGYEADGSWASRLPERLLLEMPP
jgi:hypothetical protein